MTENTAPRPKPHREPEPWGIWIAILVAIVVLVASFLIGGLAGLSMVGVVVALAILALMSRIVLG